MPELPEVETVANGVQERVRGRRIVSVWTSGKPQTFKTPETVIAETLNGARIESVRRVGKTIVMTVARGGAARGTLGDSRVDLEKHRMSRPEQTAGEDSRAEFLIHLGMTGRLLVSAAEVPLPAHTHAVLALDDGREVRFVDARRFGRLSIHGSGDSPENDAGSVAEPPGSYSGPGQEPLTIPAEAFVALFRGRRTPIKAALLNQSLLHGVGNIYADEALFRARIRPSRQAARLTRPELLGLREALVEVLRHAIRLGGSSVSDYVDADGVRGFFQLEHRVYQRTGEPCRVCGTAIKRIVIGGRSTHYCPRCQS
jgi:formamidopyrimidine-DNA glycosylase